MNISCQRRHAFVSQDILMKEEKPKQIANFPRRFHHNFSSSFHAIFKLKSQPQVKIVAVG